MLLIIGHVAVLCGPPGLLGVEAYAIVYAQCVNWQKECTMRSGYESVAYASHLFFLCMFYLFYYCVICLLYMLICFFIVAMSLYFILCLMVQHLIVV